MQHLSLPIYALVEVVGDEILGGLDNELQLSDATLEFDLGQGTDHLSLEFEEEFGSSVGITVNGETMFGDSLVDFAGETVGGVEIQVVLSAALDSSMLLQSYAALHLMGDIKEFSIGGRALSIDNVRYNGAEIPEPSSLILLGAALYGARTRKNRTPLS